MTKKKLFENGIFLSLKEFTEIKKAIEEAYAVISAQNDGNILVSVSKAIKIIKQKKLNPK